MRGLRHQAALRLLCVAAALHAARGSWLVLLEGEDGGAVEAERLNVRIVQKSPHAADVPEGNCAATEAAAAPTKRAFLDTASEHHYNVVYRIGDMWCSIALHGDEANHRGTRSEWTEPALVSVERSGLLWNSVEEVEEEHYQGVHIKGPNVYSFRVQDGAKDVEVRGKNGTTVLHVGDMAGRPSRRRVGKALQTDESSIVHGDLELKGNVSETQNIVILSAGYMQDQMSSFDEDAHLLVEILQQDQLFPLARYLPTMNVFSVFEPSQDEGASHDYEGLPNSNNLDCRYGSGTETEPARALRCNQVLSIALADTSPAYAEAVNTVVIVLVNDFLYGGTGVYHTNIRLATLYIGAMREGRTGVARSLLFHELGHALADLSDEYTVNAVESGRNCAPPFDDYRDKTNPRVCEKNCAGVWPATGSDPLGWQGWVDAGKVPAEPNPGCYFKNFFKPGTLSGSPCLMEKVKGKELCPVCREAMTLELFKNGVRLGHPTCPHTDFTVTYLALDARRGAGEATFFTNRHLFGAVNKNGKNNFELTWQLNNVTITPDTIGYATISVAEHNLDIGDHQLSLDIVDTKDWVLPGNRPEGMVTRVVWQIRVTKSYFDFIDEGAVNNEADSDGQVRGYRTCESLGANAGPWELTASSNKRKHYVRCTGANNSCGPEFKTKAYNKKGDLSHVVSAIEGWILGAGGAMILGGIALFSIVWWLVVVWSDKPRRVIMDCFNPAIKYVRRIMILANIMYMFLACCLAVLLMLLYTRVGATAQVAVIFGIGLCVLLFISGVTGLSAAWSKKKFPLLVNSIIVTLICLICFGLAGSLYTVGYRSPKEGSSSQELIRNAWLSAVKSQPAAICSAQEHFECSGWDIKCSRIYSPSNCPVHCEEINLRFEDTCKVPFLRYLQRWLPVAGSFMLLLTYLLIAGCVLAFLMGYLIRKSENLDQEKQDILQNGPIEGLLSIGKFHTGDKEKFYEGLEVEFVRFDIDENGSLDQLEFQMFFKAAIGFDLNQEQVDLLFALIDIRGSGGISWDDWKEVLDKTASKNPEIAINWLIDRKEYAAVIEDQRRVERIEEVDMKTQCCLDEENEMHYEHAYLVYGRLDNEAFFAALEEFLSMCVQPPGRDRPYVALDAFRQHLKTKFALTADNKTSAHFLDRLPQEIDTLGTGEIDWTAWMATYHIRRSAYMELLNRSRKKSLAAMVGFEKQHTKMNRLKQHAETIGAVTFRPVEEVDDDENESEVVDSHGSQADIPPEDDSSSPRGTRMNFGPQGGFGQTLYSIPKRKKEATIVTAKSFLDRSKRKQSLAAIVSQVTSRSQSLAHIDASQTGSSGFAFGSNLPALPADPPQDKSAASRWKRGAVLARQAHQQGVDAFAESEGSDSESSSMDDPSPRE